MTSAQVTAEHIRADTVTDHCWNNNCVMALLTSQHHPRILIQACVYLQKINGLLSWHIHCVLQDTRLIFNIYALTNHTVTAYTDITICTVISV